MPTTAPEAVRATSDLIFAATLGGERLYYYYFTDNTTISERLSNWLKVVWVVTGRVGIPTLFSLIPEHLLLATKHTAFFTPPLRRHSGKALQVKKQ